MINTQVASRRRSARLAACGVVCAAGVAYLLLILVRQPLESMDFRYIWLAGDLWSRGVNPYSSAYKDAGAIEFPTGYRIAAWAYPFHWYLLARLAAALPPKVSFACWVSATTLALAGATWLIVSAARTLRLTYRPEVVLFALGYACSGSIVGYALRTGQPAVVAECGVAIAIFGMARNLRWLVVSGLVLAMLKPQIGLPIAATVCFAPKGYRDVTVAAALVLIVSVPAFVASGFVEQVDGLLIESRSTYQSINYNTSDLMPGLPHVIGLLTPWSLSITGSMLLATGLTAISSWQLRHRITERTIALRIGLACSITGSIVGLHTYDLVVVLFTMPFLKSLSRSAQAAALFGFALLWRTENLVRMLAFDAIWIPTMQSIALLLILCAWLSGLAEERWDIAHRVASEG